MSNDINLNTAFTLKNGTVIKNRLFKSAMSEQLGTKDHNPTKGLATLYKTWAEGGLGLSITGNIMIDRSALGEPKNVVLDTHVLPMVPGGGSFKDTITSGDGRTASDLGKKMDGL